MEYKQLAESMTPEIYQSLKKSVESGKWPDGRSVSREQRERALQAMIIWGQTHLPEAERIGYIDKGHKAGDQCETPEQTPLTWKN